MKTYKTAESVCAGHPDKLCDFISDSILDACLYKDKSSRVACEVMATRHRIIVAGEISCSKSVDIRYEVRRALQKLGYNPFAYLIYVFVHKQSKDIAGGVDLSVEARNGDTSCYAHLGAGDQGTVYGYATDETDEYIPLPLLLSHKICKRLDSVRRDNIIRGIKPDGKAQVTVEYLNGKPKRIKTIVVSVQHGKDKDLDVLKNEIISEVLHPVFQKFPFDADTEILVNPSGRFVERASPVPSRKSGTNSVLPTKSKRFISGDDLGMYRLSTIPARNAPTIESNPIICARPQLSASRIITNRKCEKLFVTLWKNVRAMHG